MKCTATIVDVLAIKSLELKEKKDIQVHTCIG